MNRGKRPTQEEVSWVLKTADAANKIVDGQLDKGEVSLSLSLSRTHTFSLTYRH